MKTLKEALFNKKNLEISNNKYGLTKSDLTGSFKGLPLGLVVRLLEEHEIWCKRRKHIDVDISTYFDTIKNLKDGINGMFDWNHTEAGHFFWRKVLMNKDFDLFFDKYPEYRKYN